MNKAFGLAGVCLTFAACTAVGDAAMHTETSDLASSPDAERSRVSFGPFANVPIRHGVILSIKEGAAPYPERRELEYSAALPGGEALNVAVGLPVVGALPEEWTVGQPAPLRVLSGGQLVATPSDVAVVHLQESGRIIGAASGSLSIQWAADARVTIRLEGLAFVDSVRTPVPGYDDMQGMISGSLEVACGYLKNVQRATVANAAGQALPGAPEHTWDTAWKSDYCARKRPELEALLGIEFE